jgi:intracellular sulfur oxidation DsrE/DsrF family protein
MIRTVTALGVCTLLALALSGKALSADPTPLSEEKPFAEAHIILQVSDAEPVHQQATLDIANNLMKHYGGQDMADIEVIAFGAGVPMLYADNAETADRVSSLIEHGVRFYVCGNTLDTIERKQGKRPELQSGVQIVQTGVAFMVDEIRRGYIPIHP